MKRFKMLVALISVFFASTVHADSNSRDKDFFEAVLKKYKVTYSSFYLTYTTNPLLGLVTAMNKVGKVIDSVREKKDKKWTRYYRVDITQNAGSGKIVFACIGGIADDPKAPESLTKFVSLQACGDLGTFSNDTTIAETYITLSK